MLHDNTYTISIRYSVFRLICLPQTIRSTCMSVIGKKNCFVFHLFVCKNAIAVCGVRWMEFMKIRIILMGPGIPGLDHRLLRKKIRNGLITKTTSSAASSSLNHTHAHSHLFAVMCILSMWSLQLFSCYFEYFNSYTIFWEPLSIKRTEVFVKQKVFKLPLK